MSAFLNTKEKTSLSSLYQDFVIKSLPISLLLFSLWSPADMAVMFNTFAEVLGKWGAVLHESHIFPLG